MIRIIFMLCLFSMLAKAQENPRCFIIVNQQECSSCFNSLPYLDRIDSLLDPTLILRASDERKFPTIQKQLLRNSWSADKTIFSDSLYTLFEDAISVIILADSKGNIVLKVPLKDLPRNIDSINSYAKADTFLHYEIALPDSIQLSDFVALTAGSRFFFILDNAYSSVYILERRELSIGNIQKITAEDIPLSELYKAKTNDTAGYAGFIRVIDQMKQFKLPTCEFNSIWQEEDTLYLLMTLKFPKRGDQGYILRGSYFLVKISPGTAAQYIYIDPELKSDYCSFDQVNGFCRIKGQFIFSVYADTLAPEEYISAIYSSGKNGRLRGKFLPFVKPLYFRETGLGNNYNEFSTSGANGFYRILPLIYDFSRMKIIELQTSLPITDFSDLLKTKLNFYVYGLQEFPTHYSLLILEYEKLFLLSANKNSGQILSRRELPQIDFRKMNSHMHIEKEKMFYINSEKNKIMCYAIAD